MAWMKLKDAAKYSAIGRQRLIRLAEMGELKGFRETDTGYWIFDTVSIDSYRNMQYQQQYGQYEQFAKDLLKKAGF